MKLSFGATTSIIVFFGLLSKGQGQGNSNTTNNGIGGGVGGGRTNSSGIGGGTGGGQNISGHAGAGIEGYFNFHFYEWYQNISGVMTYQHLYPSTPISNGHINQLLSDLNDFVFTAAQAHQINFTGSNDVVDTDILTIGTTTMADCVFPDTTVADFNDPSFWCPVTFTFSYTSDSPALEYPNITSVKDILSNHTFNRDIFAISTYLQPLSNFLGGTLHPKGGFWGHIGDIGLCEGMGCLYRSGGQEPDKVEGGVPMSPEELQQALNEEMMANATMNTATDAEETEEDSMMMSNTTAANTTSETEEPEETAEESSASKTFASSLVAFSLMVCTMLL